ncbi:fimbrial protein [Caballeronia cordobensis]|uniref:Fimbrial protein n=1 Tax=Caballeronia cordobensis TaxID=1353886 RepID=A0A158HT72_CABCO|nr:fimbrial protein [Caballeronia cordobensis]SAL47548.1 fimbrial protein [Caballeronia cordobensis]
MNKLVYAALASGAMILASGSAFASDGTITFNGALTAQTCTVNGEGQGKDFTVTLPTVSTAKLAALGQTAGATKYSVVLSACSPVTSSSKASVFYEAGATVDPSDGRLIVASGGAANVKLQLNNWDGSQIKAGYSATMQNSQPADISTGTATLNYQVQYYATGATTAGAANSSIVYSINYQ